MSLNSNPSLGLAPGTAAGPKRGLGRDRKRGQKGRRHEDESKKEAGLGKQRILGRMWLGDTHSNAKSWVGAMDYCVAGMWIRDNRKRGLKTKSHEDEAGKEA